MKPHISKKILIKLIQDGISSDKPIFITDHINSCPACRKNFDLLQKTISPSAINVKPAQRVWKNISSYYDNFNEPAEAPDQKRIPSLLLPRLRMAGGAAAMICAGIFLYAVSWHFQFENAPMKAHKVKGLVKIDKNNLERGQSVQAGEILTTGDNSKLAIIYGKIIRLKLGPHTRIYITKSRIDKKSGKIYFEMVVDKGIISAVFDKSGNLHYTLKTPHGKVTSSGSSITMKVDSSGTQVIVKDGTANLSATQGRSINSEEGYGYTITRKDITPAIDPADDEQDNYSRLNDSTLQDQGDDDDSDDDVSVQ